ncbi:phospholipase [Pseudoalteromonas sp. NBT06-2]|uniref:sphingomyelin phosphodiesterase n=1 Tax=Pseudoalteromonas sp. NBT06-2 TaxID=2025950 RepID=UPI000BA5CBBD|nr:sphingomyelin phosphodiesterase [Pseudoalteromonas sp. NBT06-2]PAJ76246.1 phospholipase [Pseudoalteromonas sp. NBT06-2]
MIIKFLKFFLITTILLFSAQSWTQSYIYLTNNTHQPLDISVNQSGSALVEGEHWFQHAVSVPPLATVRYLETNRDTGIKWGKDYYFDTTVTAVDGTNTVLKQKLTGTWNFSNIWHGAQDSPWYNDRNIHSVSQDFSGVDTTIAFKAQYARVNGDDYYYVIHPQQLSISRGLDNNLNVLAYNVWALLPGVVSKSVSERLNQIKDKVNGYDIIVFSELFDNSRREIFLNALKDEYPYQTKVVDKLNSIEDGGVVIISRWPIENEAQITFNDCDAEDCMSAKGVMYVKINKGGNPYHIFGSHTQAWTKEKNQVTRTKQFHQMRDFIDNQYISESEPVIIAGDLNVDKIKYLDEYYAMLNILNAQEVPRVEGYEYTFNGAVNNWTSGTKENLDYVLYSTAHLIPITSYSKVLIPRSIHADVFTKYDLSDHFAITGNLTFDMPEGDKDTTEFNGVINASWLNSGGRSRSSVDNPRYILTAEKGAVISIDLISDIDSYLYIEAMATNEIIENDDGGQGHNARVSIDNESGEGLTYYKITAATYANGQTGNFSLKVSSGISLVLQTD